nr:hypothetical protein [Moritella viscosa]SHO15556.1 CRISPR-associated protein (Cas_Csy4) [Moritella viscosa]
MSILDRMKEQKANKLAKGIKDTAPLVPRNEIPEQPEKVVVRRKSKKENKQKSPDFKAYKFNALPLYIHELMDQYKVKRKDLKEKRDIELVSLPQFLIKVIKKALIEVISEIDEELAKPKEQSIAEKYK